jgi:hypothetical protein
VLVERNGDRVAEITRLSVTPLGEAIDAPQEVFVRVAMCLGGEGKELEPELVDGRYLVLVVELSTQLGERVDRSSAPR